MSALSKVVKFAHYYGFYFFYISPCLIELKKWKNKATDKKKFYRRHICLLSLVFLSYYLFDDHCVVAYLENYIDSTEPTFRVSSNTQYVLRFHYLTYWLQYLFYGHTENMELNAISHLATVGFVLWA